MNVRVALDAQHRTLAQGCETAPVLRVELAPSLPERVAALAKFEAGVKLPVYRSGQFSLPAWASNKNKGAG